MEPYCFESLVQNDCLSFCHVAMPQLFRQDPVTEHFMVLTDISQIDPPKEFFVNTDE